MTVPRSRAHHAARRPAVALIAAASLALAIALSCEGGGGPNTQIAFRVVLIEPPLAATGRGCLGDGACLDTVRVTFNRAIDTTAVLDEEAPRYFLASMSGTGFALDVAGTTVSNAMRTLVIPFRLNPNTTYRFTLLEARDLDGNGLEASALTEFTTDVLCTTPCP